MLWGQIYLKNGEIFKLTVVATPRIKRQIRNVKIVGAMAHANEATAADHSIIRKTIRRPYKSDNWVTTGVSKPPEAENAWGMR